MRLCEPSTYESEVMPLDLLHVFGYGVLVRALVCNNVHQAESSFLMYTTSLKLNMSQVWKDTGFGKQGLLTLVVCTCFQYIVHLMYVDTCNL